MLSFSPSCVSVSTHRAMSSLYGHSKWSTNMDSVISELTGPGIKKVDVLNWLSERAENECFSLTDVWAAIVVMITKKVPRQWETDNSSNCRNKHTVMTMKFWPFRKKCIFLCQLDHRRLSEDVDEDGYNPYPIYCAIERESLSQSPEKCTCITYTWMCSTGTQSIHIGLNKLLTCIICKFDSFTPRSLVRGEPSSGWFHGVGAFRWNFSPRQQIWGWKAAGEEARDGHGQTTRWLFREWTSCLSAKEECYKY